MSVALIVAHADDSLYRARQQMRYSDVRHLPVVDEQHRLVGIVSDRDLLRRRARSIREVMTAKVRSTGPEVPARHAAATMIEHHIHSLPVVGADGRLIGILTETDFLREWLRSHAAPRDAGDAEPALTYPGLL